MWKLTLDYSMYKIKFSLLAHSSKTFNVLTLKNWICFQEFIFKVLVSVPGKKLILQSDPHVRSTKKGDGLSLGHKKNLNPVV
jgi:hypothetical protein